MLANPEWEKDKLFDLSKPSLKTLAYLLRHSELWPDGFKWFYGDCDTCAMGLAHKLWSDEIKVPSTDHVIVPLGIDEITAFHLFLDGYDCGNIYAISPEMVADRIDQHLDEK